MSRPLPPRLSLFAVLGVGTLLLPTARTHAASYNWINPNGGSWTNAANFSPNLPGATTSADTINFNGSGTATTIGTIGGNNSTGVETISLDADQAIGLLNFFNTGGTTLVGNADASNTTTRTLSMGGNLTVNAGVGPVVLGGNGFALSLTGSSSTLNATNNSGSLLTYSDKSARLPPAPTPSPSTSTGSGTR